MCISDPDTTVRIERDLKSKFSQLSIVKSSDILLEIMAAGINKATAIRDFCSIMHFDVNNAIAFGDNYNMENAPIALKKKLENKLIITLSNDNDGIYNILKKIT